jgi:hypothetical protein
MKGAFRMAEEQKADDGGTKRWLVLLVQDGEAIATQDPRVETFFSEKEAIVFARNCCRNDNEGGEGAIYHVMKTTHTVSAKRRILVKVASVR